MEISELNRAFGAFSPSEEQRSEMLGRIFEAEHRHGPRKKPKKLAVVLAAALLLTACTAGAVGVTLKQARTHYFDDADGAAQAAAQAADQAAAEAGSDTAAVGFHNSGEIPDYKIQEPWDLEELMANMEQVYQHKYGGPSDGWSEMCAGGNSPADRIYYKADTLSGLAEFWPASIPEPDLSWLEEQYSPIPGGQCFLDWGCDFMPAASSLCFWGEYQSPGGAPVSLEWTFYRNRIVEDAFMVADERYRVEEYTTKDGCEVTVEWCTSQSGQSQFHGMFSYGYANFDVRGAELEPEAVYQLLDHMNLSALTHYRP